MTDDEWDTIVYVLANGWEGDFDEHQQRVARMFLDPYPPEAVLAGLNKLAQNGKPWMPKAAQIVQAVREVAVPPTPAWSEAWDVIRRAMKKACNSRYAKSEAVELAMQWLRTEQHPMVAAFVAREGLAKLTMVKFDDEEYGSLRLKELAGRWAEFTEVAQERLERGLALDTHQRKGIGPRRFDPAAALGFIRDDRTLGAGDA